MAKTNVIRLTEYCAGMKQATRKMRWIIPSKNPRKPEDLNFVARDAEGRMVWWHVEPPKTDYWHVHQVLGRAYAFELLDLMNNPDSEYPEHILAYITCAMTRWASSVPAGAGEGTIHGFFEVISEFLGKGEVSR